MKKTGFIICFCVLTACGKPVYTSTQNKDTVTTDTSVTQQNNAIEKDIYTLDINNKTEYLSYGAVLGKPMDTIMGPDTVWFYCNKELIYTETDDMYFFYKKITHWPKLVPVNNSQFLFLLERVLGEPDGSDVVGFLLGDKKMIKKVEMNTYKWWNIDPSKNYSIEELQKIIGNNTI
jgi:hypothetical protein